LQTHRATTSRGLRDGASSAPVAYTGQFRIDRSLNSMVPVRQLQPKAVRMLPVCNACLQPIIGLGPGRPRPPGISGEMVRDLMIVCVERYGGTRLAFAAKVVNHRISRGQT
jgi:hypothetical protein